jgi:hypothetical protein
MTAKLQLAVEVPSLPRSCRRLRRFGSLRRLRTAARVQLAADDREASARRRGSELAAELPTVAKVRLAAKVADGYEGSARR